MIKIAENITYNQTTIRERIFLVIEYANLEKLEEAVNSAQKLIKKIKSAIERVNNTISPLTQKNSIRLLGGTFKEWIEIDLRWHQEKDYYSKLRNKNILKKIINDIEERTEEYLAIIEKKPELLDQKLINTLHIIKEWWWSRSPLQLKDFEWWNHYFDLIEHYNFLHSTIKNNLPLFINIYLEIN